MAVASLVISVVALLITAGTLWYARGQTKAAHRSAAAADRSAEAAERAVSLAEAEAAKYSPPWELSWDVDESYLLKNGGGETAYDVKIEVGGLDVVEGDLEHDEIGPGSAVRLVVLRLYGADEQPTTVRWRRSVGGPMLEWKHPFPMSPKRR